ncbi:hypothetical protein ACFV9C_18365 [Kribbella sp. NPDC059898]|uniref:hypothetical protein n=1 Tax=Kribbella sp. NPDC059898 TaxID=3346995 RepID=UPI003654E350
MIAIATVLFAFPLGFFLRNRLVAHIAYIAIYGYCFTFQTLYLMRSWVGGSHEAFPADPNQLPIAYGVVTGGIYLVGNLLVVLGYRVGSRRRTRAVDLDPVK